MKRWLAFAVALAATLGTATAQGTHPADRPLTARESRTLIEQYEAERNVLRREIARLRAENASFRADQDQIASVLRPARTDEADSRDRDQGQQAELAAAELILLGNQAETRAAELFRAGDFDHGLAVLEEDARRRTATAQDARSTFDAALAWRRIGVAASARSVDRAIAAYSEAIRLNPQDFDSYLALGALNLATGNTAQASVALTRALALAQSDEQRVYALVQFGRLAQSNHDTGGAAEQYRQAEQIARGMPGDEGQRLWSYTLDHLVSFALSGEDLQSAQTFLAQEVNVDRSRYEAAPREPLRRVDFALSLSKQATLFRRLSRPDEARVARAQATRLHRELYAEFPQINNYRYYLANSLYQSGYDFEQANQPRAATPLYAESVEHYRALSQTDPSNAGLQWEATKVIAAYAENLERTGNAADARRTVSDAIRRYEGLRSSRIDPQSLDNELHRAFAQAFRLAHDANDLPAMQAAIVGEVEAARRSLARNPAAEDWRLEFVGASLTASQIAVQRGQVSSAIRLIDEAAPLAQPLETAQDPSQRVIFGKVLLFRTMMHAQQGNTRDTRDQVGRALQIGEAVLRRDRSNLEAASLVASAHMALMEFDGAPSHLREARDALRPFAERGELDPMQANMYRMLEQAARR